MSEIPHVQSHRQRWIRALIVLAIAFVVRALFLYYRTQIEHTEYQWLGGSDVPGWMGIAGHFINNGVDFSYWLLGLRPPLFPAVAAVLFKLGFGLPAVAWTNILFGSLSALVGYHLAHKLLGSVDGLANPELLAFAAGLIIALDPASISADVTLLAEPMFNFLFTLFLFLLVQTIETDHLITVILCGLVLGMTIMTRHTAVYFWLVTPVILIPLMRRWWRPVAAIMGVCLVIYAGWTYRNIIYLDIPTFSVQTNFSLLFVRALSAEHLSTGRDTNDLQVEYVQHLERLIGDEEAAQRATPDDFWGFLVPDNPDQYAEMGRMARQKLIRYWPIAVASTGIGLFRLYGITRRLPGWFLPIELLYHAVLYGLTLWGLWRAYQTRNWKLLLVTLIPLLYFTGLILAAQTSAFDTRMRTTLTTQIAILAVYGYAEVSQRLAARRSAQMNTPADTLPNSPNG